MDTPLSTYELRLLRFSLMGARAPASVADGIPAAHLAVRLQKEPGGPEVGDSFPALENAIRTVVSCIEEGAFLEALSAEPANILLWGTRARELESIAANGDAGEFYNAVRIHVSSFLSKSNSEDPVVEGEWRGRALLIMALGVAAFLAFVQANVTGPSVACHPFPLVFLWKEVLKTAGKEWDVWAKAQLMIDGCDLLGACSVPQYLVLAKLLLVETTDGGSHVKEELISWTWWICRALLMHQHILAERSPSLYSALTLASSEVLKHLDSARSVLQLGWGSDINADEASIIATAVQLEAGLLEYTYGHIDAARCFFQSAEVSCGLQLSVTGALGFRTVHQVDPKPQMVLVASSSSTYSDQECSKEGGLFLDDPMVNETGVQGQNKNFDSFTESDILLAPRLVESAKDAGISASTGNGVGCGQKILNTMQQALVLAHCLDIKKSNPDDELKGWQMAPFIESVDTQQHSHFMVRCCSQLLRIRWECARSRTRQRSLLMMEHLVKAIQASSSKVAHRMCYAFCVQFPTIPALLKEYAESMVSCGLIGDALRVFEELELWDELIDCYCLLEKKAAATDLINERLQHQPTDPRLWCSLGDVTLNDECYVKAWEVSGHHFARAQRSLARSAYNRGEYKKSLEHWNIALTLNPLHPGGWFALGSAALKAREMDKAIDAFTRAVQLDPDNGEAWNNVAAIHLTKKRSQEAFVAFREALKFRRNSWQMWENYAQVALDTQNFGQAIEALQMVLDLSQGKHVSMLSLTKLVEEVEARTVSTVPCSAEIKKEEDHDEDTEEGRGCVSTLQQSKPHAYNEGIFHADFERNHSKETEWLVEQVGKLLARVVHCGEGGGRIWGLLARWNKIKGDLAMCSEALLKQVRAYQGSDWQHSHEKFQTFVQASLELCEMYIKIALTNKSKRELYAARMHLRNTLKQGECFADTNEYKSLESCLEEVKTGLEALN